MNTFFVRGQGDRAQVVTPELTETLLAGVTRDSVLTLAARAGHPVAQERVAIQQLLADVAEGRVTEMFACGTAAVVTPVVRLRDGDDEWTVGTGEPGPVTRRLRALLVDIQHATAPDPDGWMHRVASSQGG